ncbi:hypothetical protein HY409_01805 [Candidatus Gottesmanbacteria bacterium]|nr:hypothetical protein [Candidatus Gottesmanbacteria bacterium]
MNPKLIIPVLGFLVLGLIGYFIVVNKVNKQPETNLPAGVVVGGTFDFGDAPDGAQGQQFPSLLASNGAHAKKTDDVWLGQAATIEKDSKQVNIDEADDGVKLNATSCKQSTVYFFVHIKNPGKMAGTAYLNLYADWNKDGRWSGSDECGAEWAVQNFAIDLGKQTDEIAVYKAQFTAGKNVENMWYRGAITLDQQMDGSATGEFASGEVEDYGPTLPGEEKYYNFYCMPDPLIINHGSKGNVKILPDLFSEPIFDAQFGQNYQPKNDKRQVTIANNTFTYESSNKDIDPPKRSVPHFVDVRVRFGVDGKEATIEKSCTVIVEHDEITIIEPPGRRKVPFPSETPYIKTEEDGSTKTESPQSPQTEDHPLQEGAPGVIKF